MAATFDYSKFLEDTGELERARFLSNIQRNKAREAREGLHNMSLNFAAGIPGSHGKNRKGHIAATVISALAALAMAKREERVDEENNRRLAMFIAKDRADKEAKISAAYNIFKSDVQDERLHGFQKEAQRHENQKELAKDRNQNALDIAHIHKDTVIKSALAKAASKSSKGIGGSDAVPGGLKDLQMSAKRISNPNDMMAYLKSNGNLPLEEITEPSKWLGIPIGKKGTGRYKIASSKPTRSSRMKSLLKYATQDSLNPRYTAYSKKAKNVDPTLDEDDIQRMYNDYVRQGM